MSNLEDNLKKMSNLENNLKMLYMKKERNKNSDLSKQLHCLRELGSESYKISIESNHPNNATCEILSQNLQEYRDKIFEYQTEYFEGYKKIWSEISTSSLPNKKVEWKSCILNSKPIFNKNKCSGEYEDCKNMEITESELKQIFSSSSLEHKITADISNKSTNIETSNEILKNTSENENNIKHSISIAGPSRVTSNHIQKITSEHERNIQHSNSIAGPSQVYHNSNKNGTPMFDFNLKSKMPRNISLNSNNNKPVMPDNDSDSTNLDFRTAAQKKYKLITNKRGIQCTSNNTPLFSYPNIKYKKNKFISPMLQNDDQNTNEQTTDQQDIHPRLKNIDTKMIEIIENEILNKSPEISWDDIAGLEYAKTTITEAVVLPFLRPDIFTGLRKPPRGILLFGPPGTGKTLLGKCIASQSKAVFFSVTAATLTSKYVGDGEKMVRALFALAAVKQPSVIFIDEIDSLLCKRTGHEHEASRRLKTEFLVQLDGVVTGEDDRVLIVGATNRPQELDEAARRRFVKRLYVPLPKFEARVQIIVNILKTERNVVTQEEICEISNLTEGFSGADMKSLCQEASMCPIRNIAPEILVSIDKNEVPPINMKDFKEALNKVCASVASKDLTQYIEWNEIYGSGSKNLIEKDL